LARKKTQPAAAAAAPTRKGGRNILWALGAVCAAALVGWAALSLAQSDHLGKAAMGHTGKLVAFGPRPSGSTAHKQSQQYISSALKSAGLAVEGDSFTAQSSIGPIAMNNIIGRIPGRTDRIFVIASHYDTKLSKDFPFVGANDGGSTSGLLLALAPLLARKSFNHEVRLVFLDGEESVPWEWDDTQSLYGSRHLAAKWQQDGTVGRVGAFILLDLIGDADLGVMKESNSTGWLQDQIWNSARGLGHAEHFLPDGGAIQDDHIPFLEAGIPAVDLIDFNYGPNNSYWHTEKDTLDKLSPRSLQVVGEVVLETLTVLDRK
jgi:Zn-dependent M28 family amino/carboxypeptidase